MPLFICQSCGAEHTSWEGRCPDCGTTETIRLQAVDRMIDRVVKGKFKILKKLGQGGMGAVYLAEQMGLGQRVALKFLKAEFSNDREIARRFLNEAKSYALVKHDHAVAIYDFGQDDDGNLFIAMEYCEGSDLKKVIAEQGRLSLSDAIEITLQLADALANAHQKGVVHRDLKPENVMIRRGLRGVHAKVLDFGIARLTDAGTKLTVAGAIAGTPRYMSPEQVEGREVDLRADIYSLGIVLYETLTGRQPFDGATIAEILRKQALDPMPHLAEASADLDYPELDAVIQRATTKNREGRWPDMVAFALALSQATPTAASVGSSPLRRPSAPLATPWPQHAGPGTLPDTTNYSGVAVPGTPASGGTEHTLLKPGTPPPKATAQAQAVTQLDGHTVLPDVSLHAPIEPPTSSKAPLFIAVGLVVVGVAAAAIGLNLPSANATVEKPVVSTPPPVTTIDAGVSLSEVEQTVREAVRSEAIKTDYLRASTEFEVANFDDSLTFLGRIPPGSEFAAKATELVAKIETIRSTLRQAEAERSQGRCETAVPLYRRVLTLNARVKEANAGLSRCKEAAISPTMEP